MHVNHSNFDVTGSTPAATGDREWAHDFVRNFQYLRGLAGLLGKGLLGDDLFLSGGQNIVKVDNNTATVSELLGICRVPVTVPDDEAGWRIPMSYKPDDIFMAVRAENKTLVFPNGNGAIKLSFANKMGGQRTRRFTGGNYVYCMADDANLSADSNSPTPYELVVATYTGAGSNLVISPVKTALQKIDEALSAVSVLAKLLTVDGTGSGLDADKLDGQEGAYYRNAGNLNEGTVPAARMPAHSGDVTSSAGSTALTLVAASVLAKLLTVDGTGSGLDADKLDGQEGAYYRNAGNLNEGTVPAARMPAHSGDVTSSAGSTVLTLVAASVLAKLLTVDGTGSGLDADKLDGLEGNAYATINGSPLFNIINLSNDPAYPS